MKVNLEVAATKALPRVLLVLCAAGWPIPNVRLLQTVRFVLVRLSALWVFIAVLTTKFPASDLQSLRPSALLLMAANQVVSTPAGLLRQASAAAQDDDECRQITSVGPGPYQIYVQKDAPLQQPRTVFIHSGMKVPVHWHQLPSAEVASLAGMKKLIRLKARLWGMEATEAALFEGGGRDVQYQHKGPDNIA